MLIYTYHRSKSRETDRTDAENIRSSTLIFVLKREAGGGGQCHILSVHDVV